MSQPVSKNRWERASPFIGPAIAGVIGFIWFVRWAGWRPLNPTDLGWLLAGDDWTAHVLGWLFFRNEGLGFPLGRLDGYLTPTGTTIAFTDSNPLVSLLLRPFSALLPESFQFIGPWVALCCVLQGVIGARLAARVTPSPILQALSGGLLAMSPLLITRAGHDTLTAQWIITGLLALHFGAASDAAAARRAVKWALIYVVIAAAVHPYLAAMAVPLALGLVWRLVLVDRRAPVAAGVGGSVVVLAAAGGTFAVLGLLTSSVDPGAEGFGRYSSDLLALLNPRGQSRWLPDLPAPRPNYEGWGFVGAGVLVLVAFALVSLAVRYREARGVPWLRVVPLLGVTLGLSVFAFGNEVMAGQAVLFRLDFLFAPLEPLTTAFRSNGRFITVAHYALSAAAILLVARLWRGKTVVAIAALAVAFAVQAADFDWKGGGVFLRDAKVEVSDPNWRGIGQDYRHLVLVPPQIVYGGLPCEGELPGRAWVTFAMLAYRERMTFNGGYTARKNMDVLRPACRETIDRVSRGELDPDSFYVVSTRFASLLARNPSVLCGMWDGYYVCVSAARETRVTRLLSGPPS